jgi:hypothetical protein
MALTDTLYVYENEDGIYAATSLSDLLVEVDIENGESVAVYKLESVKKLKAEPTLEDDEQS